MLPMSTRDFSMVPRPDVPRSTFRLDSTYKTTFDAGYLIPIFCEDVLPGDSFNVKMSGFARMATPIFPLMDNLVLDTHFFFVPYRLIWDDSRYFFGEDPDPATFPGPTDFLVPRRISSDTVPYAVGSLEDYFGLPTGITPGFGHSALPIRAYMKIWNEWFRDENLQKAVLVSTSSGTDTNTYVLQRRNKRHDYFTSALPWPQKGNPVSISFAGSQAPVKGIAMTASGIAVANSPAAYETSGVGNGNSVNYPFYVNTSLTSAGIIKTTGPAGTQAPFPQIFADLSAVTAVTINSLRQAFAIQRVLELDARGGTRYTEVVRAHFGVVSPDARLQRPEYLGGGSSPVSISSVTQQSATGVTGSSTPIGTVSAVGTILARGHGFARSFTEHGVIIGLASVMSELTYQQGIRRSWLKRTRFDFYLPSLANLGEQSIYNAEIYMATGAIDPTTQGVFGYQERWAEYRYSPSMITGLFRSTAAGTLDGWHLSQRFTALPTLNSAFIQEDPPMNRVLAVSSSIGKHFLFDVLFRVKAARPLPMYSVPGLGNRL
ncbi:MAG: major capsid protein [Microvirus sp.]|nr:MAG: major capsid protein [Microvirus sp.]